MKAQLGGRPFVLVLGLGGLALLLTLAVVAPILWGEQAEVGTSELRAGPSAQHWFGTDSQGRDVLLRVLVATRLTLTMGVAATLIAVVIGGLGGALLAILGRRARWVGLRALDLWLAIPPILSALTITAVFRPGRVSVVIAIGIAFAPQFARLSSTLTTAVSQREYVRTARLLGVPGALVLKRHTLPNIAGPLLVLTSVAMATSIITMSGLSFLGLGVQPPSIDWGQLLASGLRDIYQNPAAALAPSLAIVLTGLLASLTGEGITLSGHQQRDRTPATGQTLDTTSGPPPDTVITHDEQRTGPAPLSEEAAGDRVLNIEDLTVSARAVTGATLVSHVSVAVDRGEIVGIVGESGSGKSLTAMAAAALLPPSLRARAEDLSIAGHSHDEDHDLPPKAALEVSVVFQDPSTTFNPARKLGPQLTETLRVHGGASRREARDRAIHALRQVHLAEPKRVLSQYPHELSGGMRQRAMIAMALLSQPHILIADEPTTALDVTVQAEILRLIRKANREEGMAVLLISHDIDVVAAMCSRIYVMRAGRVIEHLSADQLRSGDVNHPYTRALLRASASYALSRTGPCSTSPRNRSQPAGERARS